MFAEILHEFVEKIKEKESESGAERNTSGTL